MLKQDAEVPKRLVVTRRCWLIDLVRQPVHNRTEWAPGQRLDAATNSTHNVRGRASGKKDRDGASDVQVVFSLEPVSK